MGAPAGYRAGLQPLDAEVEAELEVRGELPDWLRGTLLRNGPGRWTAQPGGRGQRVRHWFDGLALLHRLTIGDGRVRYADRYLASPAHRWAVEHGEVGYPELGTMPRRSPRERLAALRRPLEAGSNASVNVLRIGGRLVAVTETPDVVPVDPVTLEASAPVGYDDDLPGVSTPAHPQRDDARGSLLSFTTTYGRRSAHHLYELPDGSTTRRPLAVVGTDRASYMHSFGLTERYVVLPEYPLVADPLPLLAGRSFLDSQRWCPERGTRFTVVERTTGRVVVRAPAPATFCFHQVGAFEDGDAVVVDLPVVDGATALHQFLLDELLGDGARSPAGELRRYRVPLDGGPVTWRVLTTAPLEFPRTADEGTPGRRARWVWGTGADGHLTTSFADRVTKVDLDGGTSRSWSRAGCWPGEPVVVPAPGARAEDDGVVLVLVLDAPAGRSSLVVLDAADLSEVASAALPHAVPLGFHGQWFPEGALGPA